jgi:outer membrane receptor protein involved in Fe transport
LRNDIPFVEGFYAEVSSQSVGSYYADDANTLKVPSYTIFSATVGYGAELKFVDKLGVKAFATFNNVADQKYVSSAYINPDFGRVGATSKQAIYIEPGLPQYIVASLGLQYDF